MGSGLSWIAWKSNKCVSHPAFRLAEGRSVAGLDFAEHGSRGVERRAARRICWLNLSISSTIPDHALRMVRSLTFLPRASRIAGFACVQCTPNPLKG